MDNDTMGTLPFYIGTRQPDGKRHLNGHEPHSCVIWGCFASLYGYFASHLSFRISLEMKTFCLSTTNVSFPGHFTSVRSHFAFFVIVLLVVLVVFCLFLENFAGKTGPVVGRLVTRPCLYLYLSHWTCKKCIVPGLTEVTLKISIWYW